MAGKIIALVNAKGGSGKSTLACCIAAELAHRGKPVTLIDADPFGGSKAWHDAGGQLQQIPLIFDPTEGVTAKAQDAARHSTVIVDAAGFASRTMVATLEAADLVVIPCRASGLDAVRAIETVALAQDVAKARRRRIPIWIVLNAVTHAAITPHIRAELERAGAKVATNEIHQRTAFAVAALNGSAPCWMGSSATKAAGDIAALADELGI